MVRIEQHSDMPLQGPKFYIPLVVYWLPTAMICEIGNHRLVDGFFLLVESEL